MRTTERLRKTCFNILLCCACALVIVAVVLASFSFAGYVTSTKTGDKNADVIGINCNFRVDGAGGSGSTFINAPFLQSVSDNAQAVQMNTYNECVITVYNSSHSLNYNYSFVMYIPKRFATRMMFQYVELSAASSRATALTASRLYQIQGDESALTVGEAVIYGNDHQQIDIPNDYQNLISSGKELSLIMNAEVYGKADGIANRSFTTYRTVDGVEKLLCPVSLKCSETLDYYKLTVSLPNTENYVLGRGKEKSFLFRCVPTAILDSAEFTSNTWADTVENILEGEYPAVPDEYAFEINRASWDASRTLEVRKTDEESWTRVTPKNCIGISSPSRINVVFSQYN